MPRRFIEQLRDGDTLDDVYLVTEKQLKINRNGNPYIQVDLRDRTGSITARLWNAGDGIFRSFENGDYLHVHGRCQVHLGTLQVIMNSFERVEPQKVEINDFLPHTEQDVGKLMDKLRGYMMRLSNPHLRALCQCYLMDDAFMAGFATSPAGVKLHHAYIGGLLEHVVTMLEIADRITPLYPGVDRDLLMTGIFLHDSGKVRELSYKRAFGYTDEGQLVGHLGIGISLLTELAAKTAELTGEPMPRELLMRIQHMILSHHGSLENGSPRLPMTPEAMLLHHIDTLDTRMHMVFREFKEDRQNPGAWTPYNPNLGRRFYKGGPAGDLYGISGEAYD